MELELEGIENSSGIERVTTILEQLISDDINPTDAIDKFNEIVAFLQSIENTETLQGLLADIAS
jgi:hypothetical protein